MGKGDNVHIGGQVKMAHGLVLIYERKIKMYLHLQHIIQRSAMAVVLSTFVFGCATTVTHRYENYTKIEQPEALRLISELKMLYQPEAGLGINSYSVIPIEEIDQTGFTYTESYVAIDKITNPPPWGGTGSTLYHTLKAKYHFNFADVTKIGYTSDSLNINSNINGTFIYLWTADTPGPVITFMLNKAQAAHLSEYLSALLELCPKVS
ncbi:MAG: hypothetical protein ABSD21_05330 [Rhizomicrobium sp.]|jgi:hypothetical protein